MLLAALHVRFFKSFNFDYLRKSDSRIVEENPWEKTPEGLYYPYVTIPLEQDITTVVGGNESGKSQLLLALRHATTGEGIRREDFCRYSNLFAVDHGMRYPDFGVTITQLSDTEKDAMRAAANLPEDHAVDECQIYYVNNSEMTAYVRTSDSWQGYTVTAPASVFELLPTYFIIDSKVPLPDAVPISFLATGVDSSKIGRTRRRRGLQTVLQNVATAENLAAVLPNIVTALAPTSPATDGDDPALELAAELLLNVAHVDRSAFQELEEALNQDKQGYADGIVEQVNHDLARSLNFAKWWSQDTNFELRLSLREFDLVFLIRDRTGTTYSFDERSGGLKYFLSYFVQYLSHHQTEDRSEILLMDEPDERLSSLGQQDMLRIFDAFAHPVDVDRQPCQVLYVTHSPFLIDKNHSERIRVLEKGSGDEGTRVVRDVARNHYEPLRSAFGGFVAETTFMGNVNLFLEGQADQILIAGVSAHLTKQGTAHIQNIDLNTITLVPAGGATQIPYLVYLARGRDVEKPAVVVLVDSDAAGNNAVKELTRKVNGRPTLIKPDYIYQVGGLTGTVTTTNPHGVIETEDLIPAAIAIQAARHFVRQRFGDSAVRKIDGLTVEGLTYRDDDPNSSLHTAVENSVGALIETGFTLDKVGFARGVLSALPAADPTDLEVLEANFRALFTELGIRQRNAARDLQKVRTDTRIRRARSNFLRDHPTRSTREEGGLLLEEVLANLDNTEDGESLSTEVRQISIKHGLADELTSDIVDFEGFRASIESLAYAHIRSSQEPDSAASE